MANKAVTLTDEVQTEATVEVFSLRVVDQGTEFIIEENQNQIYVNIEILNSAGEAVHEKRLGFPAGTAFDNIKVELEKYLAAFHLDTQNDAKIQAHEEEVAATQVTVDQLQDLEISGTVKEE